MIEVSTEAGQVVMELTDDAYPDRPIRWRISPHEARQLSAALAINAHMTGPRVAT